MRPRSGSILDGARRKKSGPLRTDSVDLRITRNYAETQAPVMRAQFRRRQRICVELSSYGAVVAQLAERLPSKQGVAGSNPVRRSRPHTRSVCALAPDTGYLGFAPCNACPTMSTPTDSPHAASS